MVAIGEKPLANDLVREFGDLDVRPLARGGQPVGVLRAAEERGHVVPRELSVAGYDNIYASMIGRVSLTTVDQSAQLTGSIAARLVLERIEGRTASTHHVITPRLLVRATTAAPSSSTDSPRRAARSRAQVEPPERSSERLA